ncbi:MAG: hypothetical protein KGO02_13745, partial [Alphaproteobacteria bacterium]|nr:hypothetical protein [Alphaproteobacteria bacterium]
MEKDVNRVNYILGLTICGCIFGSSAAHALNGPTPVQIDGGPLGTFKISAAADGYFFAQSGASLNSVAGPKSNGADIDAFMIQVKKTTGPIQFTVQLAEYTNINLGANKPKEINGNMYTTGPLR